MSERIVFGRFKKNMAGSIAIAVGVLVCRCSESKSIFPFYTPAITLNAIINNTELNFPGNWQNPNRCTVRDDTMDIYFYSEDFSIGHTFLGDQIRLMIFPFNSDSLTKLGIRNVLMRFSRYSDGNSTYELIPGDTMFAPPCAAEMDIVTYQPSPGGEVQIENLFIRPRPVGTPVTGAMEISRGTISGHVQ